MFDQCKDLEEANKLFFQLAEKSDPDNGGSEEEMEALYDAYGLFRKK